MGYNLPFNAIISPREAGKTTEWVSYAWNLFQQGYTTLIIRRHVNSISVAYIESLRFIINKFYDESVKFRYTKGELSEGIVYIYIKEKLFACVCALSKEIADIKSIVLPNIGGIFFDEFIVNPKFNEKYLKGEADKFREVYNTFYRETNTKLKCFFIGNPYSLYNPYFAWWGVPTNQLKEGALIRGKNWVVWCYALSEELKKYILERNPLYEFDDSYTRYGFHGQAVADENAKIGELPQNYYLEYIFRMNGKFIEVYKNRYIDDLADRYYCKISNSLGKNRMAFAFDFSELVDRTALLSRDDKMKFARFKKAMNNNEVSFSSIEVYYLVLEVYNYL